MQSGIEPPWQRQFNGVVLGSGTFAQRLRREARGNPREQVSLRAPALPDTRKKLLRFRPDAILRARKDPRIRERTTDHPSRVLHPSRGRHAAELIVADPGARTTRKSWRWRRGCDARPRCRSRRARPGWAWAPRNPPMRSRIARWVGTSHPTQRRGGWECGGMKVERGVALAVRGIGVRS